MFVINDASAADEPVNPLWPDAINIGDTVYYAAPDYDKLVVQGVCDYSHSEVQEIVVTAENRDAIRSGEAAGLYSKSKEAVQQFLDSQKQDEEGNK